MAKFWLLLKIGQNVTFLRRKQKLALIFEKAKCGLQLIADGLIRNGSIFQTFVMTSNF